MPNSSSKPLEGRAALITGANRGLGLEIARAFVAAGCSVMLCARDGTLLEAAGQDLLPLARNGQVVRWQKADVTDQEQVRALMERCIRELNGLHVLVNNAGVYGPLGPVEDIDWGEWARA